MRVFVTGATGYIGGSVAVGLREAGHEVSALARTPEKAGQLRGLGIEPVLGSLDHADVLTAAAREADAVVNAADSDHHAAAEALVDALAGSGKALVHTSGSSIVGGDELSEQVFTEDDVSASSSWVPEPDKQPRVAIDRLVLAAADRGVRSVVLCNSLIYGHGLGIGRDSVQIPRLVEQARASGVVRHVGPGRNVWSTVHIRDLVNLYLRALESAPAGSFYFVENGEDSFAVIAQAVADNLGLGQAQSWDLDSAIAQWGAEHARYALGSNSRVRGTRVREQLGWRPQHDSASAWARNEPAL